MAIEQIVAFSTGLEGENEFHFAFVDVFLRHVDFEVDFGLGAVAHLDMLIAVKSSIPDVSN